MTVNVGGATRSESRAPSRALEAKDFGTYTERYDEEANDLLIEVSGQTILWFFPGDLGPEGEVGANGALYSVVGHVRETLDLDQDMCCLGTSTPSSRWMPARNRTAPCESECGSVVDGASMAPANRVAPTTHENRRYVKLAQEARACALSPS